MDEFMRYDGSFTKRPFLRFGKLYVSCIALLGSVFVGCAAPRVANSPGPIDADAPTAFTTTASGLKYKILRKADGSTPSATDKVTVHYKGWLDDGTVFDSSYQRGKPISFPLTGVIPGWTEGLQFVSTGGMIELEIPSDLGYGPRGAGGAIPPNATLHFLVELIEIQ